MAVQVLDVCMIKPLHATERHRIMLAPMDTYFQGFPYTREVLFYKTAIGWGADDANASTMLERLKHGLSKVLIEFYPVAGRLVEEPDGRLSLDCNDAGVQFIDAIIDAPFNELEMQRFPMRRFFDDLVPMAQQSQSSGLSADNLTLSIQVTRFKGAGGIAVGCAANHVVMDGNSYWHFLKSWGQCCRGERVSLAPFHAREVLGPECWREPRKGDDEGMDAGAAGAAGSQRSGERRRPTKEMSREIGAAFPPRPPQDLERVLHFSKDVIQRLKHKAIKESRNVRISSFQVVIAFVWKQFIHAEVDSLHQQMCLLLPINIRNISWPRLTSTYFGNAVTTALVHTRPRELLQTQTCESTLISHIHDALKEAAKDAHIKHLLVKPHLTSLVRKAVSHGIKLILVAQRSSIVYDINLGFGTPIAARPAVTHDNVLFVYPSKDLGGIDVCVCLPNPHVLHAFLQRSSL